MKESKLIEMKNKIERLEMIVVLCLEKIERLEKLSNKDADISQGSSEG